MITRGQTKRWFLTALIGLIPFSSSFAQDDFYSQGKLQGLTKIDSKSECLVFEATFSEPLKKAPGAMIDIDRNDVFEGILTNALEVISISPNKYRLSIRDRKVCNKFNRPAANVSVTIVDATDHVGRPLIPTGKTFPLMP